MADEKGNAADAQNARRRNWKAKRIYKRNEAGLYNIYLRFILKQWKLKKIKSIALLVLILILK